ncbi:MAG: hypothetical protein Q4B28_03090 [bacterium]|nr:hypothetical protein [bacterium]
MNSGSNNTISNNTYKSAVFIRGNPLLGSKLTAKILDADLPPAEDQISYQWYRDEVAISDARAKTYQTVPKDIQKNLTVKVDFTDQEGNLESAISTAVQILDAPQNRTPYDILLSATTLSANQLGAKIGQITVKDHDQ